MNIKKIFAATAVIASVSAGTVFAAQAPAKTADNPPETERTAVLPEKSAPKTVQPEKINIPVKNATDEQPPYLVKGVIKDVAQKILPVSIEARYFAPHMDMKVKSDKIYMNGSGEVGLKDNLGFGNDKAPELIFRYKRMTLDYIRLSGTGDKDFGGTNVLTFNGAHFHGNTHSKSELHYIKLNFANPIINVLGTGVDWSYGLTGMVWKGKINGTDTNGRSASKSKTFGAPIPTLGVGAHAALLPSLNVYANISGLPLGGYGHFYDFEAGVRYSPLEIVGISVGFRRIHANIKHKEDSGDLTMNGPFAGVRVDF